MDQQKKENKIMADINYALMAQLSYLKCYKEV